MPSLGRAATMQQAARHVKSAEKAVDRACNKHGGLFSRIRYPVYDIHEGLLDDARQEYDNKLVRFSLAAGLIHNICGVGMMASCGFPCKDVFLVCEQATLDVANAVQVGELDKSAADTVENEFCKLFENGKLDYVCGPEMRNFAGENLGDWKGLVSKFRTVVAQPPTPEQIAAATETRTKTAIKNAEEDLAAATKAVTAAQKALTTATNKEKKLKKTLEELKNTSGSSSSSTGAPNVGAAPPKRRKTDKK